MKEIESGWFTTAQVAKQMGIPTVSVFRYIRVHGHRLQLKRLHRRILINESAIPVLEHIRSLYGNGGTYEVIEEQLGSSGVPETVDVLQEIPAGEKQAITVREFFTGLQDGIRGIAQKADSNSHDLKKLGDLLQQLNLKIDRLERMENERRGSILRRVLG